MELDLDTGKLIAFVVGLLVFLSAETLWPKRRQTGSRSKRLLFHAALALLNTVTIRFLVYVPSLLWIVYVTEQGWGISRWLGLNGWIEIVASLVALDLFDYFWHRANHRVGFLWRLHKAHHTDTAMDVSTALRFHPGELMVSALVKALWLAVWGPTAIAWFVFEASISLCAQFHHSNIDFPDRLEHWLSAIIVTPRFHASHHAVDRHFGDANYSTVFSVWDRIFGSYSAPADGGATTNTDGALGLPQAREQAFSLWRWLLEPFTSTNLLPERLRTRATPKK